MNIDRPAKKKELKIAFLSAGLGNISRGFEISTSTWYKHIQGQEYISARLYSGGPHQGAVRVWNCSRNGKIAGFLRYIKLIHDGCRLEQLTFGFTAFFHLLIYKPDLIWVQEATLAASLLKYRKVFRLKYKLMFCDGAPVGHAFASKFDYQIFLHQYALEDAMNSGIHKERCAVIPYICTEPNSSLEKGDSRRILNIANEQFVVLCVAAWNIYHKRIDYLLNEVAKTGSKEILLLLCGQAEKETGYLKTLAINLDINVRWHTFSQDDLQSAYRAADLFVLPSLTEGLGAVLIEAGLNGLPIICHHHNAAKYILGEDYPGLTDLSGAGNLARQIILYKQEPACMAHGINMRETIERRFGSKKLKEDFLNFIKQTSIGKSA